MFWGIMFSVQLLFVTASILLVESKGSHRDACVYEGVSYSAGESFKPDPCTFCRCPHVGGEPKCAVMDCRWEPHCLSYDRQNPNECCPRCLVYGCIHSDGKVYQKGEIISRNKCSFCYCPKSGGRTLCDVTTCPRVQCVDHVTQLDSCCPTCPNGPNCMYNGSTIPSGITVTIKELRCRCRRLKLSGGTTLFASCRKQESKSRVKRKPKH